MKHTSVILAVILLSGIIYAQSITSSSDNDLHLAKGNILLPSQSNPEKINLKLVTNPDMSTAWKNFTNKYGSWTILFDEETGLIHNAFGSAIKLKLTDTDPSAIVSAGKDFLTENSKLLGINVKELSLSSCTEHNGRYNVIFKQYNQGLEVVLSKISLSINKNGNLSGFSAMFYPVSDQLSVLPEISAEEAGTFANIGLDYNINTDQTTIDNKMYILPYAFNGKTDYRLVYRVVVKLASDDSEYFTYVDAHSGHILWRQNMTMNVKTTVTSIAPVKIKHSKEPSVNMPLPDQYITIGGTRYVTDRNGTFNFDLDSVRTFNAKFEGKWAKVFIRNGPRTTANFTTQIKPGDNFVMNWNDTNSHKFERSLFYHANVIHDYAKDIDTSMSFMDFQLTVNIDFSGTSPNANSAGQTINFVSAGVSTMDLSECSSVLYHEYGHSINGLLFKKLNAVNGMVNLSCNEGTADLFSCLKLDDPRVGAGAWPADTNKIIRTLKNKIIYPDSIQGDGHYNGQILGGAFWDLREVTNTDYVARLSHFAKYGLPDDPDIGKAFSDWFIETLKEDDDDGNLNNGTPHLLEIVTAFNNHHIGTDLMMKMGFSHTQYPNTSNVKNPYPIDFKISAISITGMAPKNIKVLWSTDNFNSTNESDATDLGNGSYTANIPPQAAGTVVQYYMSAIDPLTNNEISFRRANSSTIPFQFLVGYLTVSLDSCESVNGWTAGDANDNAQRGKWENAKPNVIDITVYGYGIVQPGQNHTVGGVNCWVTGAKGTTSSFMQYMPNGKTTLISPPINVKNITKPVIRYFRWFANNYIYPYPGNETYWKTLISTDNGSNWTTIENRKDPTVKWEEQLIALSQYINANTETVMIKFVFDAKQSSSQPYSLNEGLVDDFELLAVDQSLVSVTNPLDNISVSIAPNPMTENTELKVSCDGISPISLSIYDLQGNSLINLINSEIFSGTKNLIWNGNDQYGNKLQDGIYLVKMTSGTQVSTQKVIILR